MNEKLEKLNQEIEKTEKKLRRAQHEEKILEHQIKTLTRKERTHRLCTRAAMLESYLPHPEAITDPVAILLSVLAFQVDRHAKDHRTGYTDQKVRWLETEPRGGKRCREAVPDRKQLAGEVRTGRKPKSLCQLIEGIHEQKIRKVQQKQFFHIRLCTLRSLTFTFSRSMVRCSAFSAACSFAWVSRSRMDGFSSRLIFRLANS